MFELGPVISTKGFRLRHHRCECLYKLQSQTLRNLCNHYAFVDLSSFRGHFSCLKSVGAWQSSSDTYFLRVATGRRSRFVHGKNTSRLLNFYLASDATCDYSYCFGTTVNKICCYSPPKYLARCQVFVCLFVHSLVYRAK